LAYILLPVFLNTVVCCALETKTMLRVLAALTLTAAVAVPDCKVDDSAPGCAAQTHNHLLQASTLHKAEVQVRTDVSSSVAPMLEMVESFAQLVGKEGRNLTSSQKEIVRSLNATFYRETLPTIASRHKNDVALLKAHVTGIEQCNTDLTNNSLKAASLKGIYDQASSASTTCTGEETAALNASARAKSAMTSFLKGAQPPSSTMPAIKGPTPEMDLWVQTNLAFYKAFNRSYYAFKATMTAAQAAHSTKAGECQTKAAGASGKYCTWFDEVVLFKSGYETCRNQTVSLYNKTLAASMSNMKGRKADYSALLKVECYLKVLLAEDGLAASKFTACESAPAPDLTALDIVAPAVPARAEAVLTGMGSPVDKSCHLYRTPS